MSHCTVPDTKLSRFGISENFFKNSVAFWLTVPQMFEQHKRCFVVQTSFELLDQGTDAVFASLKLLFKLMCLSLILQSVQKGRNLVLQFPYFCIIFDSFSLPYFIFKISDGFLSLFSVLMEVELVFLSASLALREHLQNLSIVFLRLFSFFLSVLLLRCLLRALIHDNSLSGRISINFDIAFFFLW